VHNAGSTTTLSGWSTCCISSGLTDARMLPEAGPFDGT
jgi:hypothetical protein